MAMAASQLDTSGQESISALLETLTTSITTAGLSLPGTQRESPTDVSIIPPQDGISLLDTKCDLLLSYLHNLVFLMIFQLRGLSASVEDSEDQDSESIRAEVTNKLVELRTYLDRGVRPLEGRLKYQVDKVIKAAEDADRAEKGAQAAGKNSSKKHEESGSEDGSGSDNTGSGSEDDSEEEEDINEMAYRPNVSAFSKKMEPQTKVEKSSHKATSDGVYRPPKIMPTAMPTTERRERRERVQRRSNVIDEFVTAEMSSAPMAEPSIGSTIVSGGRHTKTRKEKEHEAERLAYEETNFIRLAKESKKERAKKAASRRAEGTFGGEEWRGLSEGADRITKLTRRAKGSGGALEKSRKRKLTEDGQRGDGVGVGQIFEKRRKRMESRKR